MSEQKLIANRIDEVTGKLSKLHSQVAALDAELVELESAAMVITRLRGISVVGSARIVAPSATTSGHGRSVSKPVGLPTMPKLIMMALGEANKPLTPKEITDLIREKWWPEVEGQKIGSIVWRLNNRKDIQKLEGTSTYRLPQTNEPSDEELDRNTSEGSLFETPAKGREAVPGGGP